MRIGVNGNGLFRLFLENDLKDIIKNPKIIWINNTYKRINVLKNDEIDALVAVEPFVSKIVKDSGKVLWNPKK